MTARWTRRGLIGGLGAAGLAATGTAPAWGKAKREFPAVRALIDSQISAGTVPGAIAAIGIGKEPPEFVRAGSLAVGGKARVDADSLWRVYSMTKPVTGMAAMLLIAEGKLKLDQPIADIIPAFAAMRVLTDPANSLASKPAVRPITIRHLLTHTGGLGYAGSIKGPLNDEYRRLGLTPGRTRRGPPEDGAAPTAPSLATFADRLATLPLLSEPGGRWNYSLSLDLLGRVIELVSGMPFDQFLAQRFFHPLGMRSTFFTVPAPDIGRFATNYALKSGKLEVFDPADQSVFLEPPPFPFGGAGLVSSARDFDRFLAMLANGGTVDGESIMPPSSVSLGMSNLLPEGASMRYFTGPPGTTGFGAGGSVGKFGSDQIYGWLGAAGTTAMVVPARGLRFCGMINVLGTFAFATKLPEAVRTDLG